MTWYYGRKEEDAEYSWSQSLCSFMRAITPSGYLWQEDQKTTWSQLFSSWISWLQGFLSPKSSSHLFIVTFFGILLFPVIGFFLYRAWRRKFGRQECQKLSHLSKASCVHCGVSVTFIQQGPTWCTVCSWVTTCAFVIVILISLPWEFVRLYQYELSKKAAATAGGMPAECSPGQMSLWSHIVSLLRWHFSWAEDPCEKYHQALLVDPLWEVTPMTAVSSLLSRCVVHPVEGISTGLGRALRAFFAHVPFQWQPVVFFAILFLCIVGLLVVYRYSISVPLLLRIEPDKGVQSPQCNHLQETPLSTKAVSPTWPKHQKRRWQLLSLCSKTKAPD